MKGYAREPKFQVQRLYSGDGAERMYREFHPYKSGPGRGAIHFGAFEGERLVAVFSFKPPAYNAAIAVDRDNPHSVVALSRMAALPKDQRQSKHISKMMRRLWLMLPEKYKTVVTYSDSSCGHTGYVYQCAGFEQGPTSFVPYYLGFNGERVSIVTSGKRNPLATLGGYCALTRWTKRIRP